MASLAQGAHEAPPRRIEITGDDDLALEAAARHWPGNGSAASPYVIQNVAISAIDGTGLSIASTRSHIHVSGVTISSGGAVADGIRLLNVTNVTIADATLESNRAGIFVQASRAVTIERVSVKTSQVGISLDRSTGVTLAHNRLSVNEVDVKLVASSGNTLRNNNLSIATGQTAIRIEDDASLRNDADTTNVVNFVPLQWHVGARDKTLVGPRAELRGITNVAQILLVDAHNVTLQSPIAKAGEAAGILVENSSRVTLREPTVEGNAREGIRLRASPDAAIEGGSARANGEGIVATRSPGARLVDALVERNGRDGARFEDASAASVAGSRFVGNGGAGVKFAKVAAVDASRSLATGNAGAGFAIENAGAATATDNVAARNLGAGILLANVKAPRIANNTLTENAWGARLAGTSGGAFERNAIDGGENGVGLHFDDRASYDNRIDTSNTFAGEPIHWYVNATGLVIPSLRAESPRITNVGQAMVYRSRDVTISHAAIANGSADGLVVLASAGVTIQESSTRTNARNGILLDDSSNATITGTLTERNGQDGLHAVRSPNATVTRSNFARNGGDGARLDASPGAAVSQASAERNGGRGIALIDGRATSSSVGASTFTSNAGGGLAIERATLASANDNLFSRNGGPALRFSGASAGFTVARNSFQNHSVAIQLEATSGGSFERNNIAARPGQTGMHFDGPASYTNQIPPTNLFNGAPFRWYVGLNGTQSARLSLEALRAITPGMTNVAQVMVHASSNLTIESVDVANGTKHGLVIHRSENVTVGRIASARNADAGIVVQDSQDIRLAEVDSRANAGDGLSGERSTRVSVREAALRENGKLGVRFTRADVSLDLARVEGNGEGGILIESAVAGPSNVERSLVADNRGPSLVLRGATLGRIGETTLRNGTEALLLSDVRGGAVEGLNASLHARGVQVERSSLERITGGNLTANGEVGLDVASPRRPMLVQGNAFTNHTKALRLSETNGSSFRENVIRALPRQIGIHFEDVRSYDNRIETSNTFNGEPVHWHTGLRNTTLSDIRAELPGVTNVAQAMIYNASNVTVSQPVTSDGVGDGLVLYGSSGVTVAGAQSRGNLGHGITVARGGNNTLVGGSSLDNRGAGYHVTLAPRTTIADAAAGRNGGAGLHVGADSDAAALRRLLVSGNARDGIRIGESSAVLVESSALRDNVGAGIHLERAEAGARLERNTLANHSFGIQLTGTRLAGLVANEISIRDGDVGVQFDDETSYDNEIAISNRVNGVSVRWYTALAGTESAPVSLEGVGVELRGITNVAQVMLYRSAYVHLPDAVATNGTARGIYLFRSSSVTIDNATATGNDVGLQLDSTQSSAAWGTRAQQSRIGALLRSSNSNQVAMTDASGARTGVLVDGASAGNRVFGTKASGVADASVSDPSAGGSRANNLLVDAGRDLRAGEGRPVNFTGALSTTRFESERIVSQRWDFGDGETAERPQASPFRPSHVYAAAGTYEARFLVRTLDGREYADNVTVTIVGPLGAPRALSAIEAASTVSLAWQPPASDGGDDITAYRIYRGNTSDNLTLLHEQPGMASAYVDANAAPVANASYHYAVAALNAHGEGPRSGVAPATPGAQPGAPEQLSASAGALNVTLTWAAPTDTGGLPVVAYDVFRRAAESPADAAAPAHARVVGGGTDFTDAAVVHGTTYTYEISAVNALGSGPKSAPVTATPTSPPAAPSDVKALAGDRRATIAWRAPEAHADAPILAYRVYRGATPAAQVLIAQVGEPFHRDESLSNADVYGYAVSAVTQAGEGARSPIVLAAPSPIDEAAPLLVRASPGPDALVSDNRPRVELVYADNGLDVRATLLFDGRAVARGSGAQTSLVWKPDEGIEFGPHALSVRLVDAGGRSTEETWTFRLLTAREQQPILEWNVTLPTEPVITGRDFTLVVPVRNVGYVAADMPIALTLSGLEASTQHLELAPGAQTNLTFVTKAPRSGTYELGVHDSGKTTMRVIPPPLPPATPTEAAPAEDAEPIEEEGGAGIPSAPLGALLLAVALVALRARRRA